MSKNVKRIVLGLVALAVVGGLVVALRMNDGKAVARDGEEGERAVPAARRAPVEPRGKETSGTERVVQRSAEAASATEAAEPGTEEDGADEKTPEEKLVDAFDDLTDKWLEPAPAKVTMEKVAEFRERFTALPAARKDECLHRALNLIPDQNVMLLAGILFDKSQDKEVLETVFGDILNRDESVKRPILDEIFKDRAHPCWADTAWILDVTGELPPKTGDEK